MSISRTILWIVILAYADFCLHAQTKEKWQRVYTGEYSVIELNISTASLEADRLLLAQFRTTLTKPETIADKQSAKYKSRIETISFKLDRNLYRVTEIEWFDPAGAKLTSYTNPAEDWRIVKSGSVMERMFSAALKIPPFGEWKVAGYKFADGKAYEERELTRLVGTSVRLQSSIAQVGSKICSSLAYVDKRVSRQDLDRQLGVTVESLGILAEYVEVTNLKCEGGGWTPPQSMLLKVKEGEMLMLWNGVFLVLNKR